MSQLVVDNMPFDLCEEFDKLNLRIVANTEVMEMEVGSSLLQEIQKGQLEDEKIQEIKRNIKEKKLKDKILCEAHEFAYSIHPGGNKMYYDLKATYWWYGMKRDVAEYVALCNPCQRVKAEHQ
jgi:hypothetical protein